MLIRLCEWCNKEFNVNYKSECKSFKARRFCSRKCRCASFNSAVGGDKNPRWKDEGIINSMGYIDVHNPLGGRRISEHRLVASKALGRPLKRHEVVHHINMIKTDNRNSNLLVCTQAYHLWLEREYAKGFAREHFNAIQIAPATEICVC